MQYCVNEKFDLDNALTLMKNPTKDYIEIVTIWDEDCSIDIIHGYSEGNTEHKYRIFVYGKNKPYATKKISKETYERLKVVSVKIIKYDFHMDKESNVAIKIHDDEKIILEFADEIDMWKNVLFLTLTQHNLIIYMYSQQICILLFIMKNHCLPGKNSK